MHMTLYFPHRTHALLKSKRQEAAPWKKGSPKTKLQDLILLFRKFIMQKLTACPVMPPKKSGFSRAFGVEDLRDRAIEQLAVGGKNILGVGIAVSDLCIKIGCWRRDVIGIMEFRAAVFPHGLAEVSKIAER